jgi:hypothetical protein
MRNQAAPITHTRTKTQWVAGANSLTIPDSGPQGRGMVRGSVLVLSFRSLRDLVVHPFAERLKNPTKSVRLTQLGDGISCWSHDTEVAVSPLKLGDASPSLRSGGSERKH